MNLTTSSIINQNILNSELAVRTLQANDVYVNGPNIVVDEFTDSTGTNATIDSDIVGYDEDKTAFVLNVTQDVTGDTTVDSGTVTDIANAFDNDYDTYAQELQTSGGSGNYTFYIGKTFGSTAIKAVSYKAELYIEDNNSQAAYLRIETYDGSVWTNAKTLWSGTTSTSVTTLQEGIFELNENVQGVRILGRGHADDSGDDVRLRVYKLSYGDYDSSKDIEMNNITTALDGNELGFAISTPDSIITDDATISATITSSDKFYFGSIDNSIQDITNDGTYFYICGDNTDTVYQLNSSLEYTGKAFYVGNEDSSPIGITYANSNFYMCGSQNDSVYQYDTDFIYQNKTVSVTTEQGNPLGVAINDDGTKMYVVGNSPDSVFQYTMSTPYDVSTATYDSIELDVSTYATTPQGLSFNAAGTTLYISDSGNDDIVVYTLSTAFDLSTASYSTSYDISSYSTASTGVYYDETNLYITDSVLDGVYKTSSTAVLSTYSLSAATIDPVSKGVVVGNPGTLSSGTLEVTFTFATTDTSVTPTLSSYGVSILR